MANKTYIGLHPNNLNRTKYGEITLYVEGEPAAFFSGSSNVTFSGSLGIQGIADVSASIAALQSAGAPTLQQVTDQGNSTSQSIDLFVGNNDLFSQPQLHFRSGSDFYTYGRHSIQFDNNTLIAAQTNANVGTATLFLGAVTASFGTSPSSVEVPLYTASDVQVFGSDARSGLGVTYPVMTIRNPQGPNTALELRGREADSGVGSYSDNLYMWFIHPGNSSSNRSKGSWRMGSYLGGSRFRLERTNSSGLGLTDLSFLDANYYDNTQVTTFHAGNFSSRGVFRIEGNADDLAPIRIYSSGSFFMQTNTEQSGTLEKILVQDQGSSQIKWISPSNLASQIVPTSTLDSVTDNGSSTTNAITVGGVTTSGTVSAGVVTTTGAASIGTTLEIGTLPNATVDTDKFLVLDNGVVKGRTGEQVASDIGAITVQPTLQNVAAAGNTITGSINVGIGSNNPTLKLVVTDANEYKIRAGYPYSGGRYLDIGYQAINIINPAFAGDFRINIDGDTKLFVGPDAVASSGSLSSGKKLFVSTVDNASTDTDKFLVLNGSEIEYRTGAQVLSDIGAGASSLNLQQVTDNGNETTNDIIAAKLSGSSLGIIGDGEITGDLVVGGIVTAQEFHTEFVSASIIYQSGSTKFGDTSDDNHNFTGSVFIKDVTNADADRDKFLVIDANGKVEYRSGSQVLEDIGGTQSTFDGERGITQTLLPSLLNFNPQTTTVEDFLDAVFYPPSPEDFNILSNEPFSALESQESGSIVHAGTTGVGTAQAQFSIDTSAVITWTLQSTGIFQIDSSTGELSLNTDFSGSATFQAPKSLTGTVVATSNLGSIKTAPFTVTVVENQAPTITFQTVTPNNNKTTGAASFGTITITDLPQGVDTVSIDTLGGADAGSFTLNSPTEGVTTVYSLSSSAALQSGSYSLDVTGSDSYDNVVSASFTVSVAENLPPVITQTGFFAETTTATSGSNIGTITVSDPQDDSIASFSFVGSDAALFNAIEASSTATSKTFNIQPFNDLSAGSFNITGSGTDSFGLTTLEPIENEFTLPVPDTPTPNNGFYIIESALSGSHIVTNSDGFTGATGSFSSDQAGTWSISGTNFLVINQDGELSLKADLSGSTTQAPGTLGGTVKITNNDGQSATATVSVALVDNVPATITPNLTLSYNEAETTGAIGLGTITVADPQAYENVEITDFTGQSITLSTETAAQSVTYEVSSSGALTQGSYTLQVTASDSYGHDTKALYTFVVAENLAPTVTPSGFVKSITQVTSGSEFGTVKAEDLQ